MAGEPSLDLTPNALDVLRARYLRRDPTGQVVESPEQMFRRVARAVAAAEAGTGGQPGPAEERFLAAMAALEFLPNSPTLMNAGTQLGQLAACFVLPVEDSLESIFTAVRDSALIHQSGGGVGYDFSRIRPRGAAVASTGGVASGPLSFMKVFDASVDAIRQGGRRRGANMGILDVRHPDVEEFVAAKRDPGVLANFNLSVAAPDAFLAAARTGADFELRSPATGRAAGHRNASLLLDEIAACAWETGDPGMIFLDRINRDNPTPELGQITATNPCGEVPLLPYEACMLGSINLGRLARRGGLDWSRLAELVELGVRFLDDCLDASRFPLARITETVRANRKIGLGLMGFADALVELDLAYDSEAAEKLAGELMAFVSERATEASRALARERGPFPSFVRSRPAARGEAPLRNATTTAIAPTGTLSLLAGCSSGIEPFYALAYERHVLDGRHLLEVNPRFERLARAEPGFGPELLQAVLRSGSLAGTPQAPERLRRLFRTAAEISPEWHVRIQAAFQRHVDNAVSKTINLPRDVGVQDVRRAYELAFESDCKGITIYREGSKRSQVLTGGGLGREACPECGAGLRFAESIAQCRACGYSAP
jgi:ribonucleoside-diphosphate reductase alpha chain